MLASLARFSRRWFPAVSRSCNHRRRLRSRRNMGVAAAAQIEPLESRILLSCQQFFDRGTGTLTIEGDASPNEVSITVLGDGSVEVVCDGGDTNRYVNVHTIDVSLMEDDDRFTFGHNASDFASLPDLNVDMGAGRNDVSDIFLFQSPSNPGAVGTFQVMIVDAEEIQVDAGNVPGVGEVSAHASAADGHGRTFTDRGYAFILTTYNQSFDESRLATLEIASAGMDHTRVENRLSGSEFAGDLAGFRFSQAGKPLLIVAEDEDVESETLNVEWRQGEGGRLAAPAVEIDGFWPRVGDEVIIAFEAGGYSELDVNFTAGDASLSLQGADVEAAMSYNSTLTIKDREGTSESLHRRQRLIVDTSLQTGTFEAIGIDDLTVAIQSPVADLTFQGQAAGSGSAPGADDHVVRWRANYRTETTGLPDARHSLTVDSVGYEQAAVDLELTGDNVDAALSLALLRTSAVPIRRDLRRPHFGRPQPQASVNVVNSGEGNSVEIIVLEYSFVSTFVDIPEAEPLATTFQYDFARSSVEFEASRLSGPLDIQTGVASIDPAGDIDVFQFIEIMPEISLSLASIDPVDIDAAVDLDLDLTSTSEAPLFAAISIPNLLEARASGNETSIHLSPPADGTLAVDHTYEERATVETADGPTDFVLVGSKVKQVIQGGQFHFLRDVDTLAVEIDGAEIHEFDATLDFGVPEPDDSASSGGVLICSIFPCDFTPPPTATIGFSNVRFIDSTVNVEMADGTREHFFTVEIRDVRFIDSMANLEMIGPRQRLLLSDVELINSDLTIENRPSETRSDVQPVLMVIANQDFTVDGGSRFSHVVQGTDQGDTILIGAFDSRVDGEYALEVHTGDGPDRFFGVFDLAGSTGFVSIRVFTGDDDDRAALGVFGVEGLQRLFALLDGGEDADHVLASPEVTVLNSGDLVERPGRDDDDDSSDAVDFQNLFLAKVPTIPVAPTFERLFARALTSDFLEYRE